MAKSAVQTFGKYQILERIATGGMAEIYKARLEGIGGFQRTFAIKRVLPHLSQNAEYVAMLVDEAKVAGLLSHANIVQILDLGQVEGVWYIAMEYVHGPDLGTALARCRSKGIELPLPHTCFIAIELLKGLEYAHNRQVMRGGRQVPLNIIHRDVSPPNILLSTQGEVKLTDFGIARASLKAMETASGVIKGRYDYMSPEQASGSRDLDHRSDLFSVGVVLYEMLTGVHPFRTESELTTAERIRVGSYRPASEVNPGVPFPLETIVDRALRADPSERYPTATAFKDALDKFFHDAGFLFSHHGLAAYVDGLFPDFGATPSAEPADAEGAPPPQAFDDEDGDPTRVIDKSAVLPGPPEGSDAATFGLRRDETATLVRKSSPPDSWQDEPETLVRRVETPASSATPETDTHSRTATTDSVARSSPPRTFVQGDERDTFVRRGLTELTPAPSVSDEPSTDRGLGSFPPIVLVASGLALALTLLIGLFLGASIGLLAAQNLGIGKIAPASPTLRVHAPSGVRVSIDGAQVEGTVALQPNVVHPVTVRYPGLEPVRINLTLQPGEVRLIVVSPLDLETR